MQRSFNPKIHIFSSVGEDMKYFSYESWTPAILMLNYQQRDPIRKNSVMQ